MSGSAPTTMDGILQTVSAVVTTLEPLVAAAFPGVGAGLAIATEVIKGVQAAEPAAVALYNSIVGGTQPTAAQIAAYVASNAALNAKMDADVNQALAAAGT